MLRSSAAAERGHPILSQPQSVPTRDHPFLAASKILPNQQILPSRPFEETDHLFRSTGDCYLNGFIPVTVVRPGRCGSSLPTSSIAIPEL